MAVSKDQIKDLLGQGLDVGVVASAVGCDHSYISHLMSDPEFSEEVIALRTKNLSANNERDRKIDLIEDKLIAKLDDAVEFVNKPAHIAAFFKVVNAARRRGVPAMTNSSVSKTVVNLNIPKVVINNFIMNQNKEVIEVEGKTLVTMQSQQLLKQLQSKRDDSGEKDDRYKTVANFLPGSTRETIEVGESSSERDR